MAGVLLANADTQLTLEALCKEKRDPVLTAFEKDLDFILNTTLKRAKKTPNHESCLKL